MKRIFLTIYVLIVCTAVFVTLGVTPLVNHLMTGIELEEERSEFGGLFTLISQDLESMPSSAWQGYVEGLTRSFKYPITVMPNRHLDLPERYRKDHADGLIVSASEELEVLVKLIPGTEYSLSLGPLPEMKYANVIELLIVALAFAVLALPVFAWSLLLWRDLSLIEDAARTFGRGTLTSRARVSRFSSLPDLKRAFNAMADRIEKLIASHKDLTNAVSHELRTPLSRMRFGMEMVKTGKTREDQERYFQGIERDVGEIETLVDEMLTYARFDREPGRVEPASHELAAWLRCIVACEKQENAEIRLEFNAPEGPLESWFDPQYMAWAVRNLVRNAMCHAATQVCLTLECHETMVSLFVDDDGKGIPEAHRERIFEPFARLDDSRNRKSGGYGLGLAIVKRIAIAHNGDVAVEDSPFGGARFTLSWPRDSSSQAR